MSRSSLLLVLAIAGSLIPRTALAQTAVCRDGTVSYSRHRSGTCSHHGGVAQWGSGSTALRSDGKAKQPQHGTRTSASSSAPRRHVTRRVSRPARRPAARANAASRGYYTGPRGGCYTYSASGRKRYVDHSFCH